MTPPIRTPADAVAFLRQLAGSPDGSITHAALANAANALEAAIAATPVAEPETRLCAWCQNREVDARHSVCRPCLVAYKKQQGIES